MSLSGLPNIGKVIERRLTASGIKTPEELKSAGAKEAFLRICRSSDPGACVRVLYALQGAIDGAKDSDLNDPVKKDLLAFFRTL